MGKRSRPKPERLAEKLLQIRNAYGLSQNEMISRLGLTKELIQADISSFERGIREPPLPYLLDYARTAGGRDCGRILEILLDDELDLPEKLTSDPQHGIVRPVSRIKGGKEGKRRTKPSKTEKGKSV
jgi:transcriptional regulator with XRE-family HTH domain